MQDRRPGAGEADDEHRRDDLLVGDRGEPLAVVHVVEAVHRVPQRALARDVTPDLVEPGVALERPEEPRHRLDERAVTEVVEAAGAARGFGNDRVDFEAIGRGAHHAPPPVG